MAETNTTDEFLEDGVTPNPEYKEPEGEGGETDAPPKKESGEGEEPDIPVRNSASQVIARQRNTIKKLKSKAQEDEDDEDYQPPTGGEGEDEDELTSEAQGAVGREVQRQMKPFIEGTAKNADEQELSDLFESDPESKEYEKQIRAYMKVHPTATPGMIYHHLAFDEAETTGAGKKKTANTDARQQRGGGRNLRPNEPAEGGVPSIEEQNDMSDEDFEATKQKAMQGGFVPKEEE